MNSSDHTDPVSERTVHLPEDEKEHSAMDVSAEIREGVAPQNDSNNGHISGGDHFEVYVMKSMREYRKYTSNGLEPKSHGLPMGARSGDLPTSMLSSPMLSAASPIVARANSIPYSFKSPPKLSDGLLYAPALVEGKPATDIPHGIGNASQGIQTDSLSQQPSEEKPGDKPLQENQEARPGWSFGSGFRAFRDVIANKVKFTSDDEEDDWDFWGKIVSESPASVKTYERKIRKKVYGGIPAALRGIIWQTLSNSNDPGLESTYKALLEKKSHYSNIIERDASRTFPEERRFAGLGKEGQQSLFNLVNAYSVYDPETGYCQGIAFLAGILLFNISEEGAFCTLVRLMKDYNLRDLYSQTMSGLNTKIYQFDCLMKELYPSLVQHFDNVGVNSSMYVSQWFLTIFSYRFPLEIVFVIMDVLLVDGLDSIVIFSLSILSRSESVIMDMDFEPLLEFLKGDIIKPYIEDPKLLIEDYKAFRSYAPRVAKYAKIHDKKLGGLHIGGDPSTNNLQMELSITKGVLESIKKDFGCLNEEYMNLSKKYEATYLELERANRRAKVAEDKLDSILDGICSLNAYSDKDDDNMVYAERLIQKNIDIVSENISLKEKLEQLTKDADHTVNIV